MSDDPVVEVFDLGMPWAGLDPFIFTVHHLDNYPAGNDVLGPVDGLAGRNIGSDFSYKDGWSMYHGDAVPGFPQHPHRGFETVTVVRRGYVDHSDSLGATARYGGGDAQWLTTGSGIMHAEMFPLLDEDAPNPLELFQIWLNLPPQSKMVPAHFAILWDEDIPTVEVSPGVWVDVVAGEVQGQTAPAPPPDSWAADPANDLGIWIIQMEAGASWEMPAARSGTNRVLHCFEGDDVQIGSAILAKSVGVQLNSGVPAAIVNHGGPAQFLLLQGQPIGAPVFQLGPFVMNTPEELQQALDDYRRTQFGGWPWSSRSHVHARSEGRFAVHADGKLEHREMQRR
ncbi:MAG: pirin family protein [Acidimicrobiia bacterium]|nr:pirin family protein [Acidimicrobiia bacterium]MDH5505069.1 pirin family protein [Acidimicrobiia bacterium]